MIRGLDTRHTKNVSRKAFLILMHALFVSANAAFLALVAADNGIHTSAGRSFAETQLAYMLGSTGRSFVVGFVDHRAMLVFVDCMCGIYILRYLPTTHKK